MKLDRNLGNGLAKYALIKLRVTGNIAIDPRAAVIAVPVDAVDFGDTSDTDFFVIRLKDKYAAPALAAYAGAAMRDDPEYALEVLNLAKMAAEHPNQKRPD
jgi:hypothetical protein